MSERELNLKILLIDDSPDDGELIVRHLKKAGLKNTCKRVENEADLRSHLKNEDWDFFICDFNLPQMNALQVLAILKAERPSVPCIVVSGSIGEEKAVETMRAGASDYVMKDRMTRLVPAILRELEDVERRRHSRQVEEALRKSEESLQQAQKFESVGQLAGGIAHDFNNILAVILMQADHLSEIVNGQREWDKAIIAKGLEQITKSGERASNLTRQLLTFSRRQMVQTKILNLNDVVRDMEKMLKRIIEEHIDFSIDLSSDLENIKADPSQIEQIILNLIVNARDALPRGGSLKICTKNIRLDDVAAKSANAEPGNYTLMTVIDTGTGIDPETLKKIFDPFFTTKPVGKGTGLGLSTVYGIVKQNKGFLSVDSELGKGTAFNIYLPATFERLNTEVSPVAQEKTLKGSETILVVEDEKTLNDLVCETLRSKGYNVLSANNGVEGLKVIKSEQKIDMVITDVVMPQMGGPELAKHAQEADPKTKILFQSGYMEDTLSEYDVNSEQVHFLEKPYSLLILLRKVRAILDKPRS